MRYLRIVSIGALLLTAAAPVVAHHGMAAYDFQKNVSVKGTVTKFDFSNPHVMLYVEVKDGDKVVQWVGETGSPNMMRRGGWTKTSIKAGDEVTMSGHPARDGSSSMRFMKIVFADGRTLDPSSGFD